MAELKVLHTRVSVHKRASSRSSATRSAAYRSCSKIVDQNTGEIHDFTRKKHLVAQGIATPKNAPAWTRDRAVLWGKSDKAETRCDAQLAREITFSLPRGLSKGGQIILMKILCDALFTRKGMVADWAIHSHGSGDPRNLHAHVMLTTRELKEDGFGKKERGWNDPRYATIWRKTIADLTNSITLSDGGKDRVIMTHESFEELGIDKIPKKRLSRELYQLRKCITFAVESNAKEVQNERSKSEKTVESGIERGKAPEKKIPQRARESDFEY